MNLNDKIDELIEKEVYVIDILPEVVPEKRNIPYAKFEKFFLKKKNEKKIYQKFLDVLLKLNCYYDFEINWKNNKKIKCEIKESGLKKVGFFRRNMRTSVYKLKFECYNEEERWG